MNLPGFNAEASLYKTTENYFNVASSPIVSQAVTPQLKCPPAGLCAKASRRCQDPIRGAGSNWCEILDRCVDCHGV